MYDAIRSQVLMELREIAVQRIQGAKDLLNRIAEYRWGKTSLFDIPCSIFDIRFYLPLKSSVSVNQELIIPEQFSGLLRLSRIRFHILE